MRRVVVLGGGHSKFCYNSPKTSVEMLSEVAIDAIRESNLSVKDIQAVNVGNIYSHIQSLIGFITTVIGKHYFPNHGIPSFYIFCSLVSRPLIIYIILYPRIGLLTPWAYASQSNRPFFL